MTEAEKAYQYFVIAVPENEEQAKAYFWARKALRPTLTPPNEPLTPCDLCRYNPPSSFGGKPCCMCPAEAMTKEDNQNEKSNAIACLRGKLKSAGGYQWIRERKEEV